MASIKLPEPPPSTPCQFRPAWTDGCGKPTDNGWCDEHEKLMCVSCKKKATRSCDAQMGGLGCGAPLCNNCQHSKSGHVTGEKAAELYAVEQSEERARIGSRTNPEQRTDENGCPLNLFEVLKGDPSSYELQVGYFLSLEHGLMGFFPAIFADDSKRVVVTLSKPLIEKVWKMLPPRKSRLSHNTFYVVKTHSVAFADVDDKERSGPDRYLTEEEFEQLTSDPENKPFKWAPGLIGNDMSSEEFLDAIITIVARTS